MPGFLITNIHSNTKLRDITTVDIVSNHLSVGNYDIYRNTINRFMNDKIFFRNESFFIILEGVVLNATDLINKYKRKDWISTVIYMIENNGNNWFKEMEGPVSGAIYYITKDVWVIFTGYLGEKAVFYWKNDEGLFAIASQLNYITDILKMSSQSIMIDEESMMHMMAYGSYIGEETCVENIRRLYPGNYLINKNSSFDLYEYNKFDFEQSLISESDEELINKLDFAFTKAVCRILKKNREYGYMTVADISAGCDSRLNVYSIEKNKGKHDNIIYDCYAQIDSSDSIVSKEIAKKLSLDYCFLGLDSAKCMIPIDENVLMLNGTIHYYGLTGGRDMLRMLTGMNIGLEITGLLGDVHDGSMVTGYSDGEIDKNIYRYSNIIKEGEHFTFPVKETMRFKNNKNELFWFHNRGMLCGMCSFFIRQNYTEAVTPFGDLEFLKVYLSIPWEKRVKERLLQKWLVYKYPNSGDYKTTNSSFPLKKYVGKNADFNIYAERVGNYIKRHFTHNYQQPIGMNDVDYWYNNNNELKKHIDSYIEKEKWRVYGYKRIEEGINILLNSGSPKNKYMVVTVLSILKNFGAVIT